KQGHLEEPARIGHLDKRKPVAARRGPFLLSDDDAGKFETSGVARRQACRQLGKADDAGAFEALAVGVERVARQVETNGNKPVLQFSHRRPISRQRQSRAWRDAWIELAE